MKTVNSVTAKVRSTAPKPVIIEEIEALDGPATSIHVVNNKKGRHRRMIRLKEILDPGQYWSDPVIIEKMVALMDGLGLLLILQIFYALLTS